MPHAWRGYVTTGGVEKRKDPGTWRVAKYVASALFVGFITGISFYAVLGPGAYQVPEDVQVGLVALLTGAVGVIGLILGAAIGANGAREAAEIAMADASEARRQAETARQNARTDALDARTQDREDQRAALFADPIRKAAAEFQASGTFMLEVAGRAWTEVADSGPVPISFERNARFYDLGQELRLIVRYPRTYKSVDRVVKAVASAEAFVFDLQSGKMPLNGNSLLVVITGAVADAYDEFENAVRVELGAPALSTDEKLAGIE